MKNNDPAPLVEVTEAFARYETALVGNDVAVLDQPFLDAPTTIRYGGAENLYGIDAIRAFRAARSPAGLARRLAQTQITTYGDDCAVAVTLFYRDSAHWARSTGRCRPGSGRRTAGRSRRPM